MSTIFKHSLLLLIISFYITLLSCKKEKSPEIDVGVYTGVFSVKYSQAPIGALPLNGPVSLTIGHGIYKCTGNQDHVPSRSAGYYQIISSNTINFQDWLVTTHDHDGHLHLGGPYFYYYDGNHLQIYKVEEDNSRWYLYDLYKEEATN